MNHSPKAIFFDIDGTLINRKGGPFEEDLAAMEEAAGQGHFLFINTGRSYANIPRNIPLLPLWSGIAAGGGTHVLLAGSLDRKKTGAEIRAKGEYKTLYHKWVDKETLSRICSWYLESGKDLILEGENDCYVINLSDRSFSPSPARIITRDDDFLTRYQDDCITKLTVLRSITMRERELLESSFKIHEFEYYSEAIIKGETKAKAIGIALEAINVKQEDSIAIGDSANDIDMLLYAGLGIAMGNADDRVKAASDAVTGNCGEGGVAEAIKRYVL